MDKEKIIKYISDKIEKALNAWGAFARKEDEPTKKFYDNLAIEIYSHIRVDIKIKKMASGKCDHEFELLEEDGFYPEFEKVQCTKCMKIKMRKICSTKK